LKKWLDVAQQFQGKDFWSDIFDESPGAPFTQDNPPHNQVRNEHEEKPKPQPATDLYQTPTEWIIVVDLPGVGKSDIKLTCIRNVLTIKGSAKYIFPEAQIIHSERLSGEFERTINLPENVEGVKPIASFRDGLLIIRIPRLAAKAYQIDIE
jgi:HSP20 family protein